MAASADKAKNQNQPDAAARKPESEASVVRPTADSAVSSANWVAVCSGLLHRPER